jgi:lysylphosphatidylglycerol synthetase-like protein (DUF2156 family)
LKQNLAAGVAVVVVVVPQILSVVATMVPANWKRPVDLVRASPIEVALVTPKLVAAAAVVVGFALARTLVAAAILAAV